MKKSGSRASKLSSDVVDSIENPLPGVPNSKWHDFLEKEETDLFILGLREEILNKCMEICFHEYLEKQAVAFTVHCAYLAWCKVLNVYYMVRDPGSSDDPKEKESWEPDLEPKPSKIDSWGRQCIPTLEPPPPTPKVEREPEPHPVQSKTSALSPESVEFCSFYSGLFDLGEGEFCYSPQLFPVSPRMSKSVSRTQFSIECLTVDTESARNDEKFCLKGLGSVLNLKKQKKKKRK